MARWGLFGAAALVGSAPAAAQDFPVSRALPEESRQFDFWVGEWDVNLRVGQDHVTWRDSHRAVARIYPILSGKAMLELWTEDSATGIKVDSLRAPESLRWDDASSSDGGETWTHNWIMEFTRRAGKPVLAASGGTAPTYHDGDRCDAPEFRRYEFLAGRKDGDEQADHDGAVDRFRIEKAPGRDSGMGARDAVGRRMASGMAGSSASASAVIGRPVVVVMRGPVH